MPTYEYACRTCGEHLEVVQSFHDDPITVCGACGGALRKVFSPAGIIFKGSGYYVTDNRKAAPSSSGDGAAAASSGSSDSSGSSSDSSGSSSESSSSSGSDSASGSGSDDAKSA